MKDAQRFCFFIKCEDKQYISAYVGFPQFKIGFSRLTWYMADYMLIFS